MRNSELFYSWNMLFNLNYKVLRKRYSKLKMSHIWIYFRVMLFGRPQGYAPGYLLGTRSECCCVGCMEGVKFIC